METLHNWLAEKRSAYLYRILAKKESQNIRGELFLKLSKEAENQASIWKAQIIKAGFTVPQKLHLSLRIKLIAFLIKTIGPKPIRTILAATKIRGMSIYTYPLPPTHEHPISIEEVGKRHTKSGTGQNLRAAIFGVNDGLVSNSALIFGMASAAAGSNEIVLISGISGLLAGAFSMAAGEYISVRSQREFFEYQIGLEAEELRLYPNEEAAELALIYQARGLPTSEAESLAKKIIQDPEIALDTLAKEELGIDPKQLASPYQAAFYSFISFSLGALCPLLPFFIYDGSKALELTAGLSALALISIGVAISLFTGKGAIRSAIRMLAIGAAACFITYIAGWALNYLLPMHASGVASSLVD